MDLQEHQAQVVSHCTCMIALSPVFQNYGVLHRITLRNIALHRVTSRCVTTNGMTARFAMPSCFPIVIVIVIVHACVCVCVINSNEVVQNIYLFIFPKFVDEYGTYHTILRRRRQRNRTLLNDFSMRGRHVCLFQNHSTTMPPMRCRSDNSFRF